jgi:hypothetical protein
MGPREGPKISEKKFSGKYLSGLSRLSLEQAPERYFRSGCSLVQILVLEI